ncbi:MAG TPA: FGGY-family carbohydrate kinase [Mesorhizobium sp.]
MAIRGSYFIGVDVGTGSARAGIFNRDGDMLASARHDIGLWREHGILAEQSSSDIWRAVCAATREALALSGIRADEVAGLGFDATCSLVVLGEGGAPLAVGSSEDPERNIIVWMDHRATEQAQRINATGHPVLNYVGGSISPEMETPKLLWLKENRPHIFDAAWQFFDLTDFLTWKATDDLARSTCTVTCKWTYLAHEERWDPSYFDAVGLGVLADESFSRIGQNMRTPGTPLGQGLTPQAAAELGLSPGTPVGAGLIDAHAGGIGTVGIGGDPTVNLGYIFGTSSCTMATTAQPVFVPGVWGPYFSAMVPGVWLNEGGQSAAGAAIDQLISFHPASEQARRNAEAEHLSVGNYLANLASGSAKGADPIALAKGLHVVPEFLGNRAPLADPFARAVISGLGMERDMESLVALYVAGLAGIGYGLRQIIETQQQAGIDIENVVLSGGAGQHDLVRHMLANACDKPIVVTKAEEPVLLGAAILGAVASRSFPTVASAMAQLSRIGSTIPPTGGKVARIHQTRYQGFKQLQSLGRELQEI